MPKLKSLVKVLLIIVMAIQPVMWYIIFYFVSQKFPTTIDGAAAACTASCFLFVTPIAWVLIDDSGVFDQPKPPDYFKK